jgi:hypothetical protein
MADEAMGPTVTVHMRLAKFEGEFEEGKTPVEVIETSETAPLAEWLARQGGDDHA